MGDVREAIDFLRYYANEARRLFTAPVSLTGVTGESNCSACAAAARLPASARGIFRWRSLPGKWRRRWRRAIPCLPSRLSRRRSLPFSPRSCCTRPGSRRTCCSCLPGGGEVGAALVKDHRVAGVAFTGSNQTGWSIQNALAARRGAMVPLIAETGGINAMIADSSALPEQVIRDLVRSAFDSAGQRCSAARLFFVQEDVAKVMIDMLVGAVEALDIGDPLAFATDIGPVIDDEAVARLEAHKLRMQKQARQLVDLALPDHCRNGTYVTPAVYALEDASLLREEVFGPILHVARFSGGHLDRVIESINQSGYGLTLGVHSRIASVADLVAARARVGNLYVNRNQIGAVVGVQPFGGEGLSGTGPKAGGPNYLTRFASERVVSTDITATGGNVGLLGIEAN